MEKKPASLAANSSKVACQGSGETDPGVESMGNPPGKRVRMKQCSFEVVTKDGSRILGGLAASKGLNSGSLEFGEQISHTLDVKVEKSDKDENLEAEHNMKGPVRQCVESRREQRKSYGVDECRREYRDGGGSLKYKKGGRAKAKKTSEKMDGVGTAIQSGGHQSTDIVVIDYSQTSDHGLGGQPPAVPTTERTSKLLEKGSNFFLPTSKKLILKQQRLKSEAPYSDSRNPDNVEAASEKRSKRCKHAKDANANKGHSPQNASTKQHISKRKQFLLENQGQVNSPKDGNESKLSEVGFNLRLEAKQAAEENMRLSAGKGTHPFFIQQRPTQTRAANFLEGQFVVNQQNARLSKAVVAPCLPFHITQNDQVEVAALDWKGWEFLESNIWQQDDPKVLKEALKSISEERRELLKSGVFCCFLNCKEHSLGTERNSSQDICLLHEPLATSGGVDMKKQMEKLFVYLESRAKHKSTPVSAEQSKDSWSNLSLKDIEKRFMSYHSRRNSGMNNLWTDKYQPETSDEVCGNSQPVVLVNDWLRCWRERVFSSDKEHMKEIEINCRDEDWGYFQDEDETSNKDSEGDGLKNILLLTGPVGCGKSAALYACAKEQGFDVIEVNASECRSGTLVKQKFGEAMESHGLNQRAVEDVLGMNGNKNGFDMSLSGKSTGQKGNTRSKVRKEKHTIAASGNRKQQMSPERGTIIHGMDKRRWCQSRSNALILFEDVDTTFDDDRGFMGALLQIAETAKRPIVLTSNRRNPSLPRLLDRLTIQLELPSMEELVSHVFMVCIAEGVLISPSLVEHVVRCCFRDLRKTLMLLQFWCQGNNDSGREAKTICTDGHLSHNYSSIPFELDLEHRIMPKMMPWSFPCKLSEAVNINISKALDEEKEQVWLNEAKLAEEHAAREKLDSQLKSRKKKWTKDEKKSWMLEMHSFADESMRIDRELDSEIDELSKVTLSSAMSLDHRVRRRRCAVVSSDSEDANSSGTLPAISETQLQDPSEESPVERMSKSDDMTFPDPHVSGRSPNQKGSQQGEHSSVFRRLRKMQDVDLPETSSLMDVSCVQESVLVSETVWNCNNISHVKLVDFENTSRGENNSITNTCSPIEGTQEHHNTEFLSKGEEDMLANCEKETEMLVENDGFTALQTGDASSDAHLLKCKENADDNKLNLTWCMHNKEKNDSVPNTIERLNDRKGALAVYDTLPLMDECSRVDFNIGSCIRKRQEIVGTGYPVQQTWLKMKNSREDFKSLLDLGCEDALSAIDLVTTLTDIISSGDLLISSCGLDHSDVSEPLHGSRNFNINGDDLPASCSDERMEIASALVQQGLSIMVHSLGNESGLNLDKEILTASTDSVAVGKLILAQRNDEMVCNDQFSKIDLSATEHHIIRQARETVLSDTLDSLIPLRSHFMSKGVAFHEHTSFLGRISKLEESRLLQATTSKRRTRGFHHYLSSGRYSLSTEDILLLCQYSSFGKVPGT